MPRSLTCLLTLALAGAVPAADAPARPNVIVVITDDQGYGDLGVHGNPIIKTPNLDKFAKESMQLRHFYVSPVCSPTRASLMTGRWNYRTGVVDTSWGRSMMHADETTIAEVLSANGYRTGIFGKWHLGDCYPMRPIDQGFQEALVLKGGGLGQPSDIPGGGSYFNPKLLKNGVVVEAKGYVSDILTDATIDFVSAKSDKPFFAYLAFNCPHAPLEVKDEDVKPYKAMKLGLDEFPKAGFPVRGKYSEDDTAKIYGMVSNIDMNLGRLFKALDDRKLADNTIVVFLTDNGPQQPRYVSGFRGRKGSVYEGGVRVPFYARWPGKFPAGKASDALSAHVDIFPTLLAACGIAVPKRVKIDGVNRLGALKGEKVADDRLICLQWHRGEEPELNRACMARQGNFKIVQPEGVPEAKSPAKAEFELYDLAADPYEQNNLAAKQPETVKALRTKYEAWFADVRKERNFRHPRIHVGSDRETPTVLTRQDWRGSGGKWDGKSEGYWDLLVERPGKYRVGLLFEPAKGPSLATLKFGGLTHEVRLKEGSGALAIEVELKKGNERLEASITDGTSRTGARYVEVERVGD